LPGNTEEYEVRSQSDQQVVQQRFEMATSRIQEYKASALPRHKLAS